jgi:hypothetical protein
MTAQAAFPHFAWQSLIASARGIAAVAPTRHLLADAISGAKAKRKNDQISNRYFHLGTRCAVPTA